MDQKFKFRLDARVALTCSDERGAVIGRAEYCGRENCYLVRYKAATGEQREEWWDESAICKVED